MASSENLQRFIDAQQSDYKIALSEIKSGRKRSHWMWYIFPQIQGLGFSETSRFYAINNIEEAEQFLRHPLLGKRLVDISNELLHLDENNARRIFGTPDNMKLKSSMTLFSSISATDAVFEKVLKKFFDGKKDDTTLAILAEKENG